MKILRRYPLSLCIATLTFTSSIVMGMDRKQPKNFADLNAMTNADLRKSILKSEDTFRKTLPDCKLPVESITAAALFKKLQAQHPEQTDSADKAFVEYFKSVTPVFSNDTFTQVDAFVKERKKNGSPIEQKFYADKTAVDIMPRLYDARPYSCYGDSQTTFCAKASRVTQDSTYALQNIGTKQENGFFCLVDFPSVAERDFSQRCGLTSKTLFLNSGHKANKGKENYGRVSYQPEGYITVMGAVNHNIPNLIHGDYIREQDNNQRNGDLVLEEKHFDQTKLVQNQRLKPLVGKVFNTIDFKKTITRTIFDVLSDANDGAKKTQKRLYYQMPAFNSNEWFPFNEKEEISHLITQCFLEAIVAIVQENSLDHIAVINCGTVAWNADSVYKKMNVDLSNCKTKIVMNPRNPSAQLTGEYAELSLHTLCLSNGFSLIGNKLWAINQNRDLLTSSEETVTACSSYISAIMNPKINPFVIAAVRKQAEMCQAQLAKKLVKKEEMPQPVPSQPAHDSANTGSSTVITPAKACTPKPAETPQQPDQAAIATQEQTTAAITTQKNAVAQLLIRAQALKEQEKHSELIERIATMEIALKHTTIFDQKDDATIATITNEISTIEQEQLNATQAPQQSARFTTTQVLGGIATLTALGGGMLYHFGLPTVLSTMWNNLSLPNPQAVWDSFVTKISNWLPWNNSDSSSFAVSEW